MWPAVEDRLPGLDLPDQLGRSGEERLARCLLATTAHPPHLNPEGGVAPAVEVTVKRSILMLLGQGPWAS